MLKKLLIGMSAIAILTACAGAPTAAPPAAAPTQAPAATAAPTQAPADTATTAAAATAEATTAATAEATAAATITATTAATAEATTAATITATAAATTTQAAAPAGGVVKAEPGKSVKMVLLPKFLGIAVFDQANKGAQEAHKELKNPETLQFLGPTPENSVAGQIEIVTNAATQGVQAIMISNNAGDQLGPAGNAPTERSCNNTRAKPR